MKPIRVPIITHTIQHGNNNIEVVRVIVDGDEYDLCEKSSHNMWANKKRGMWGKGYKNTDDDPRKVERTGRLGEMAFSKISGSNIDFSYIEGGDKYDVIYKNKTTNIKVALALYGVIMVRCESNGHPLTLHEDVYVFSHLSNEDRINKTATIDFLGCLTKPELITKPKIPKREWINYECPYSELHTMLELFSV